LIFFKNKLNDSVISPINKPFYSCHYDLNLLGFVAQVHQLVAVCFTGRDVFLGLALGQALQVVRGATDSTTCWPRCGGGFLVFVAPAAFGRGFGLGGFGLGGFLVATAAVSGRGLGLAVRALLAHQGAARLLAVRGAVALPVAQWLFAHTFAFWRWVGALGVALGFLAHGVALGARTFLAMFHWAADFALGLVALDGALTAAKLLAAGGASGLFADRFAHLVADGGVALPLALGVAVTTFPTVTSRAIAGGGGKGHNGQEYKSRFHLNI